MTRVGFHPAASLELRRSAAYYEARVPGLGGEFIAEIERICALLIRHPALGTSYDIQFRRVLLRRFPFALIYRATEGGLTIIAVAHNQAAPRILAGSHTMTPEPSAIASRLLSGS